VRRDGSIERPTEQLSLPAIMCEGGLDEAFLVGTVQELSALAHRILASIDQLGPMQDCLGIPSRSVSIRLTDRWGDACLDGMVVTSSSEDSRRLVNALRMNNGQAPVAADGWPT
jgi:hypothetical protein